MWDHLFDHGPPPPARVVQLIHVFALGGAAFITVSKSNKTLKSLLEEVVKAYSPEYEPHSAAEKLGPWGSVDTLLPQWTRSVTFWRRRGRATLKRKSLETTGRITATMMMMTMMIITIASCMPLIWSSMMHLTAADKNNAKLVS